MKKIRLILLIFYTAVVLTVYLTFKDNMNINISTALLYTVAVVGAIALIDFLFNHVKSALFFSSIAFAILFLLIGDLLARSLDHLFVNEAVRIGFLMFCVYAGLIVGARNAWVFKSLELFMTSKGVDRMEALPKVLDTSVLIDGRIVQLVNTGVVEGKIIIPSFVLVELQHIADAHEHLRRQKGKRGLETLQKLQEQKIVPAEISRLPEDKETPVDAQLINMAQNYNGVVVTTDHNLAMVAKIQKVKTININDIALAMRQPLLPGESMTVQLTKEGKEQGQALAYLDDGTMVVVDSARKLIGQTVSVEITSLLQTDTGRIIFAALKEQ